MGVTQVSISEWKDKQNVVSTYNGIALKRKQTMTYATRWLNLKDIMLKAMSATKVQIWLYLNEILVTVKITEPETRLGGGGEREANV